MNKGNIPFGEDFPFFPPPDNSIHTLADFAYLIIKQAYQILLKAVCPAELQPLIELISPALAFNFQALEAERNQAQALSFDLSLILPPFADPRLCFPVMQGCRKRAVYGPCSFCETFLMRPFRLFSPPQALLYAQKKINWLDKRVNKGYELFLTEGDALAAPFQSLETIIRFLAREFPEIPRIGAFSSVLSIMGDGGRIEGKSFNELQKLRQAGLTRIYLGIESGSDPV